MDKTDKVIRELEKTLLVDGKLDLITFVGYNYFCDYIYDENFKISKDNAKQILNYDMLLSMAHNRINKDLLHYELYELINPLIERKQSLLSVYHKQNDIRQAKRKRLLKLAKIPVLGWLINKRYNLTPEG